MYLMRYIVAFICVKLAHTAFDWVRAPETVHACAGGEAMFPWHYDEAHHNVTMVYWRYVKTGNTVLGHHLTPVDELKHYFPQYERRVALMDPTEANAGLVLMEVTPGDAGDYLVELSGPVGAVGQASLVVHSEIDSKITMNDEEIQPRSRKEIDWTQSVNISLTTADARADLSITQGDIVISCPAASKCEMVFTPDYYETRVDIIFGIMQEACHPQKYTIYLSNEGVATDSGSSTGIIVGVVLGVITLIVIVGITVLIIKQKKRKKHNAKMAYTISSTTPDETKPWLCDVMKVTDVEKAGCPDELQTENDVEPLMTSAEDETRRGTPPDVPTPAAASEPGDVDDPVEIDDDLYATPLIMSELEGAGFWFNEKGELRSRDTDKPFDFNKYPDHAENQQRYEELGEIITDYIYKFMEEKLKLERITFPADGDKSFFFASPGAWKKDKLLVLIHGSGVVRAGQWARRLIINDDLEKGTQFGYIQRGLQSGYGVVVLNTNHNVEPVSLNRIRFSGTPESHATYVWEHFILPSSSSKIAIVAHSYGGCVVTNLADNNDPEFFDRVFAVGFTDSVHGAISASARTRTFLSQHAVNWVSSDQPLDEEVTSYDDTFDAKRVSSGHIKHEWTSYSAMKSVFKFLEKKLASTERGNQQTSVDI